MATCDGCGRSLCLACAIPVRGLVYGGECLPDDVAGHAPSAIPAPPPDPAGRWTGIGLGIALIATFLPWTRFGRGSGGFGAWNATWAGCATVAFLIGALVWAVRRFRPGRMSGVLDLALVGFAGLGLAATIMALLRPPTFARPWIGLWIAIAGGAVALAGAISILIRDGRAARVPRRPRLG